MATREEILKAVGEDLLEQIRQQAMEVGESLQPALDEVADYIAERAEHLSKVVGEPGFERILLVERNNVILKAATRTVVEADKLDARLLASAQAGLAIAARLIALMVV